MYPSSNNDSFSDNYNYYSKIPQENYYYTSPSSSSFLLPSPNYVSLEDEQVFGEFFQPQFLSNDHNNTIFQEMITNVECSNNGQVAMVDGDVEHENTSPRKRPNSKGDRHSKINTAQGPRDRRMRLSLDVAKKLFGLQDLLGFDKASKTVDWLLTKSKSAILELLPDNSCSFMGVSNSASSTSECEVLSGDQSMVKTSNIDGDDKATTKNKAKLSNKKQKEKNARVVRRSADLHHPLAKATRARARARARERTNEKRNVKFCGDQDSKFRPCLDQVMDQNVNQLGSWSPFTESQRQSIDPHDHINLGQFQIKQGFVGDNSSMMMKTGNLSPSYFFNYQHIHGLTHEHQFNDFRKIGKAWEDNTN